MINDAGGAGFKSKTQYNSGLFTLRIKMSDKKTDGMITDQDARVNHDEIDFEFIGTQGKLQTNIFANDMGGREQVFQLPFDPSQDFHTYQILYTPQRIVKFYRFFVDNIPIRTFENNTNRGINYPTKSLWSEASLWISDAVGWAGSVEWGYAPFIVSFQDFNISGCPAGSDCLPSTDFSPWTRHKLASRSLNLMRNFRKKYMTYDYCSSEENKNRYPECENPQKA
uniref:Xyloglucan endotransglucosylase/hydrolase n=1 Tax=Solanum lycopersicum TaxID=4081 RepID=A0A3Q7H1P8_SOLLC